MKYEDYYKQMNSLKREYIKGIPPKKNGQKPNKCRCAWGLKLDDMGRVYNGMVIRTSYGTGPYRIVDFTENCTCPSFMDVLNLGKDAPPSRPHYHFTCRKVGEDKGVYIVNGYDENLNSLWNDDRVIVCAEETLFLTICCGL